MIKQTLLVLGLGVAAAFTGGSADAFFGNRGHHRSTGCGGNYYATPTYSTGYSPYAYQARYSRSSYRPSYSGSGYNRYGNPYAGYGYRGYSSRFGGNSGLMGYGNGYYYGGFPTARASGIGIVPRLGYGW